MLPLPQNLLMPFRLKILRPKYGMESITVLDVGCGSHSPTITKRFFPDWNYYGIDREWYGNDAHDRKVMSGYFELDLSRDSLTPVPDGAFDVVILSHIIEHLPNGLKVIEQLTHKLKKGGRIYVEFPGERSLGLPSMLDTLQFCDDSTHVRVYSVAEVANTLLSRGFRIIKAGTRRDKLRIFLFPLLVPIKYVFRGHLSGGDFWDVTGFASFVYAEKTDGID